MTSSRACTVLISVRAGLRNDPEGYAGLGHLCEHLLAQGPTPLARLIRDNGNLISAHTYFNTMELAARVPVDVLPKLLDSLQRVQHSQITNDDLGPHLAAIRMEARELARRQLQGAAWRVLPSIQFNDWSHAHDGFGEGLYLTDSLGEAATVFLNKYCTPESIAVSVTDVAGPGWLEEDLMWAQSAVQEAGFIGGPKATGAPQPQLSTGRQLEVEGRRNVDLWAWHVGGDNTDIQAVSLECLAQILTDRLLKTAVTSPYSGATVLTSGFGPHMPDQPRGLLLVAPSIRPVSDVGRDQLSELWHQAISTPISQEEVQEALNVVSLPFAIAERPVEWESIAVRSRYRWAGQRALLPSTEGRAELQLTPVVRRLAGLLGPRDPDALLCLVRAQAERGVKE